MRQLLDGKVSIGLIKGPARDRGVRSESFMEDELIPIAAVDAEVMTLDSTEAIKSTVEVGYPDRRLAHNPPYVRATSWRLCPSERVFWATGYSFDFRVVQCGRICCGLELGTRKAVEIA